MRVHKQMLGAVAEGLIAYLETCAPREGATILALSGDLGAGKTALVQQIANVLSVSQIPPSPTFVIMRSYETSHPIFRKLVHIDAYRLESDTELKPLHLDKEFATHGALVCIEWPEKLAGALPERAIQINLISVGENERELTGSSDLESALQKYI